MATEMIEVYKLAPGMRLTEGRTITDVKWVNRIMAFLVTTSDGLTWRYEDYGKVEVDTPTPSVI